MMRNSFKMDQLNFNKQMKNSFNQKLARRAIETVNANKGKFEMIIVNSTEPVLIYHDKTFYIFYGY